MMGMCHALSMRRLVAYAIAVLASVLLFAASIEQWLPISWQEVVATITGAWTVWLIVKNNVWNWPLGLATSTFSGIVFFSSRLFADAGLQVAYFSLGLFGWYWWLHGGKDKQELPIQHSPKRELLLTLFAGLIGTVVLRDILIRVNGAAPFLDALLTSFSLVAQYLITRRYIENWVVWIIVDVIYVPLFISRGLHLIAVLYAIYLGLAIAGWIEWRKLHRQEYLRLAPEP